MSTSPDNVQQQDLPAAPELSRGLETALVFLFGVLALLGLANAFSLIVNSYDHNESLYLTAGWLMAHDHRLYVDFAFWQMPYSPLIYAVVFKMFQPENHLLAGKMVSVFFLLATLVSTGGLLRLLAARWWLVLAAAAAMLWNITVVRCAMEASNYIMPMAFTAAGLWTAAAGMQAARRSGLCLGLSGLLLALAVGTKLYYLLPAFGVGLALFGVNREGGLRENIRQLALPFLAGFIVGLLPILPFWLRDPELFMLNNLGAHHHTTAWWNETAARFRASNLDPGLRLEPSQKLAFTRTVLTEPANLMAGATLVIALITLLRFGARPLSQFLRTPAFLIVVAALVFAWPAAFAPTPMWYQYLGTPTALAVLLAGVLLANLQRIHATGTLLLAAAWVAGALYGATPTLKENFSKLRQPSQWVAVGLPQIAREVATKSPGAGPAGGRLLCLQQLMAVESGHWQPYPELAYAPFTWVIADRLPKPLRDRSHFLGPQELAALLKEKPAATVLSGLYDTGFWSDATLDQWASAQGWNSVKNPYALRVYVPPVSTGSVTNAPPAGR